MKKHIFLDLWRGTEGWLFYSTLIAPPGNPYAHKTRVAFEGKRTTVHIWSEDEFTYAEVKAIFNLIIRGKFRTILKDGQWTDG